MDIEWVLCVYRVKVSRINELYCVHKYTVHNHNVQFFFFTILLLLLCSFLACIKNFRFVYPKHSHGHTAESTKPLCLPTVNINEDWDYAQITSLFTVLCNIEHNNLHVRREKTEWSSAQRSTSSFHFVRFFCIVNCLFCYILHAQVVNQSIVEIELHIHRWAFARLWSLIFFGVFTFISCGIF